MSVKYHLRNPAHYHCECGHVACRRKGGAWICQRCATLEAERYALADKKSGIAAHLVNAILGLPKFSGRSGGSRLHQSEDWIDTEIERNRPDYVPGWYFPVWMEQHKEFRV